MLTAVTTVNLGWLGFVIVLVPALVVLFRLIRNSKKMDREGIEVDAIVTKVEQSWNNTMEKDQTLVYVRFLDQSGQQRENLVGFPGNEPKHFYQPGDTLRIRYLPEETHFVTAKED